MPSIVTVVTPPDWNLALPVVSAGTLSSKACAPVPIAVRSVPTVF